LADNAKGVTHSTSSVRTVFDRIAVPACEDDTSRAQVER
jgi:hypothetical protein